MKYVQLQKQSKEDPTAFDLAEQKMQLAQQQRHEQVSKTTNSTPIPAKP